MRGRDLRSTRRGMLECREPPPFAHRRRQADITDVVEPVEIRFAQRLRRSKLWRHEDLRTDATALDLRAQASLVSPASPPGVQDEAGVKPVRREAGESLDRQIQPLAATGTVGIQHRAAPPR